MQKKIMQNKIMRIKANLNFKTRNATCCNNGDDLSNLCFILKISIFPEGYVEPSRISLKSSIIDHRLDSKYASAFTLTLFNSFVSLNCFTSFKFTSFHFILQSVELYKSYLTGYNNENT